MRVKLLTRYACPSGNYPENTVIDVTPVEAKQLINGGYATIVDAPVAKEDVKIETAAVKPIETANIKPVQKSKWGKK